jgi:hypothetical protein
MQLPGGSSEFPFNHLALRRAPALQEETDKARDRAEGGRANEEDREALVKVLCGEEGDGGDHDRDSSDGDSVWSKCVSEHSDISYVLAKAMNLRSGYPVMSLFPFLTLIFTSRYRIQPYSQPKRSRYIAAPYWRNSRPLPIFQPETMQLALSSCRPHLLTKRRARNSRISAGFASSPGTVLDGLGKTKLTARDTVTAAVFDGEDFSLRGGSGRVSSSIGR